MTVAQFAGELVRQQVAVIASAGGPSPIFAAKAATTTIPIVFTSGIDPIKSGLVASLNRPGGNITGVNLFTAVMEDKRLSLLRELVPSAPLIAVLVNGSNPNSENQISDVEEAARAVRQRVYLLKASNDADLDKVFSTAPKCGPLRCSLQPIPISSTGVITSSLSRRVMPFPRYMNSVSCNGWRFDELWHQP